LGEPYRGWAEEGVDECGCVRESFSSSKHARPVPSPGMYVRMARDAPMPVTGA
jgi:hypothetical protein